jgi:RNA polymerase sigma-70 factor, ECF subfamily
MNMSGNQSPDDSSLINRSVAGDTEAFGELVFRYQDRLYNSLVHYLRNESEAEEVLQDSFILSFTRLSSFQGKSSFYTWLYRIAFNTAISRRRRKRPQVSLERDIVGSGKELDGGAPSPESQLDEQERSTALMAALGRLHEDHRSILVLREMDELSYEEISEILDLPVGTVRSRLHRARAQLKDELAIFFQDDTANPAYRA